MVSEQQMSKTFHCIFFVIDVLEYKYLSHIYYYILFQTPEVPIQIVEWNNICSLLFPSRIQEVAVEQTRLMFGRCSAELSGQTATIPDWGSLWFTSLLPANVGMVLQTRPQPVFFPHPCQFLIHNHHIIVTASTYFGSNGTSSEGILWMKELKLYILKLHKSFVKSYKIKSNYNIYICLSVILLFIFLLAFSVLWVSMWF